MLNSNIYKFIPLHVIFKLFFLSFYWMVSVLSPIQQYVVDFVIKLRKEKKLTQSNIGVIINATVGFIGNVENPKNRARYNLDHINALADYFNMAPGDFLPKKAFPVEDRPKKGKDKKE